MIKVTVVYPNSAGAKFDMQYYTSKHLPTLQRKCGAACKSIAAEQGLSGGQPGSKPPYIALCHLTFDSVEAFQKAFSPHAAEVMADIPNYTNVQPIIQISEITL